MESIRNDPETGDCVVQGESHRCLARFFIGFDSRMPEQRLGKIDTLTGLSAIADLMSVDADRNEIVADDQFPGIGLLTRQ